MGKLLLFVCLLAGSVGATQDTVVVVTKKGAIDGKIEGEVAAHEASMAKTRLVAVGAGFASGIVGGTIWVIPQWWMTRGDNVPQKLQLSQEGESEIYKKAFAMSYKEGTRKRKRSSRLWYGFLGVVAFVGVLDMAGN